jgi:ACT domain-containing protein
MKERINAYLFNNGYSSNIVTAYYLAAIINKPPEQTVTMLVKQLGINRSYYYKLYNKHKTFIEMIKHEIKNENKKAR